jgi:hypothetical protein
VGVANNTPRARITAAALIQGAHVDICSCQHYRQCPLTQRTSDNQKLLGMGNKAKVFNAEKWALTKSLAWVVKFTSNHPHKNIKSLNFYMAIEKLHMI